MLNTASGVEHIATQTATEPLVVPPEGLLRCCWDKAAAGKSYMYCR